MNRYDSEQYTNMDGTLEIPQRICYIWPNCNCNCN